MKRFRFSLQPVAVLRAHQEMTARDLFAAAALAYRKTEDELARIRARVMAFEDALSARRQGRFSGADEAQTLDAYRRESLAEGAAEKVMIAARGLMQQRRAEYLEARRRVEVVQRLEQKARMRHRLDGLREEQAVFDETAGHRFLSRPAPFSA